MQSRFGDLGPRQLRLLRNAQRTKGFETPIPSADQNQGSPPLKKQKTETTGNLPSCTLESMCMTPPRKPKEYSENAGFLLTPKVKEEEVDASVFNTLLRSNSMTDQACASTSGPKEPEIVLTANDLSVYTSLAINVSGETPLRCLAHLSRGTQSIPLDFVDCCMENDIADQTEKYRKLLEQQKWIEQVLGTFNGYVGGIQQKSWLLGMVDLSRKIRAGTVHNFYIVSSNMTILINRQHALADPTTAHFRSKLQLWNIPFDRSGVDEICTTNAEDDRELLEHVNQAKRVGDPYKEIVFSDNALHRGIEQLKPLKFTGQRAILGLLDFLRQHFMDFKADKQLPRILAQTSFSGAIQEFYRIEKISFLEHQRYLLNLEGHFCPDQVIALCGLLEPFGDYNIGLSGAIKGCAKVPSAVTCKAGERTFA